MLQMRIYKTGATRDTNENKISYKGFLSPEVLQRYGEYMLKHQTQADGKKRTADNWKKGIEMDDYIDSMWRHFHAVWLKHEHGQDNEEDLCALFFNVQGYLFEKLKRKPFNKLMKELWKTI